MYITYKDKKYNCKCRPGSTMIYSGLPDDFPTSVSGEVILFADDGFELRRDKVEDYLRQTFEGGVLTLTNEPEPVLVVPTVDEVRAQCLGMISQACNQTIVAGVDVELNGAVEHFNLSDEDQRNIDNLFRIVYLGGTRFPYQADGSECRVYTVSEIAQIYVAAQTLITTQTAYHNALKKYVNSMETVEEINGVSYGMELPEPYLTDLNANLAVAQEEMAAMMAKLQESQNAASV